MNEINKINFDNVINKLVNQYAWKRKHALEICELYRRFLFLQKKYGDEYNLPPSEDIDEFWHMHILDTKAYRRDCEIIFGKYLDHDPNLDSIESKKGFRKTLELYAYEFKGEQLYEIRSVWAKIISFIKACFFK